MYLHSPFMCMFLHDAFLPFWQRNNNTLVFCFVFIQSNSELSDFLCVVPSWGLTPPFMHNGRAHMDVARGDPFTAQCPFSVLHSAV